MTPADSASATSANPADPTSVDPAEVVTFADIDDPLPVGQAKCAHRHRDRRPRRGVDRAVRGARRRDPQRPGRPGARAPAHRVDLGAGPGRQTRHRHRLIVADPRRENDYRPALAEVGYDLVIREPGWHEHRAFRHQDPDGTQRNPLSNLHVFGPHCPEFVRHRLFRDWLTATPDDRRLYEHAKRLAAEQSNDAGETTMDYNARKQSVIRDIYHRLFAASGLL